jgi:hypothetical protein
MILFSVAGAVVAALLGCADGGWKLLGDGVIGRGRGYGGVVTGFGHESIAVEGSGCAAGVRFSVGCGRSTEGR